MSTEEVIRELQKILSKHRGSEKELYEELDAVAEGWKMRLREIEDEEGEEQEDAGFTLDGNPSNIQIRLCRSCANKVIVQIGGHLEDPSRRAMSIKGGKKGGKARAESLTPKQRSDIARKAAKARWNKKPEVKGYGSGQYD